VDFLAVKVIYWYMELNTIITFLDANGRIIYGKYVGEDGNYLRVADPAQIYVQPTQQGQLNVQSVPLFFKEFVKNTDPIIWRFNRDNIVINENLQLDDRLITQYNGILAPRMQAPAAGTGEPKVIKLFDE